MNDINSNKIESVIMKNCQSKWLKISRVLWQSREDLSLEDDEQSYELIERELRRMVNNGYLEVVGDVSRWRESEVRRADN